MQGEGRPGIVPVDQFSPERSELRLDRDFGKGRRDGVREAFEPINDGDQDVLHAPALEFVHHRRSEFGAFVVGNPEAENLADALPADAEGQVDGLIIDHEAVRCPAVHV